jgi:hypothetical protein
MIGPAWTYNSSLPKPAGSQNMGTWTRAVYTEEQKKAMTLEQRALVFGGAGPEKKTLPFP